MRERARPSGQANGLPSAQALRRRLAGTTLAVSLCWVPAQGEELSAASGSAPGSSATGSSATGSSATGFASPGFASPGSSAAGDAGPPAPPAPPGFGSPFGAFGAGTGIAAEAGPSGPARTYVITPRIDVSEAYESNFAAGGYGAGGNGASGGDFETDITPSISVIADAPRLQGSLYYAPTVQLYAYHGNQNFVSHNLNGAGTLTVLADAVYLNASAFATLVPRFGGITSNGFGPSGSRAINLPSSQQQQFYSYTFQPYAVHRFGDIGTATVSYTYAQSLSNNNGTFFPSQQTASGLPLSAQQNILANTGNGDVTTSQEAAQFVTGDILNRFRSTTLINALQFSGAGVVSGAHQNFYTETLTYALTHQVNFSGSVGYEDISYNTLPPTLINDVTWAGSVQVSPNPYSSVTVGYGHQFGYNSAFGNGSYAVTARTTVTGYYINGLGSGLQGLQGAFGASSAFGAPGAFGAPSGFGAPAGLAGGGAPQGFAPGGLQGVAASNLGVSNNNNLYRTTQGTLSVVTTRPRDSYSLSVSEIDENLVGTAAPGSFASQVGTSQQSFDVSAGWLHDLSPTVSSRVNLTYARTRQSGQGGTSNSYEFDASLDKSFSPTLNGYARYTFYDNGYSFAGSSSTDNIFRVGVSKSF